LFELSALNTDISVGCFNFRRHLHGTLNACIKRPARWGLRPRNGGREYPGAHQEQRIYFVHNRNSIFRNGVFAIGS
jgi:hypothetical protein